MRSLSFGINVIFKQMLNMIWRLCITYKLDFMESFGVFLPVAIE